MAFFDIAIKKVEKCTYLKLLRSLSINTNIIQVITTVTITSATDLSENTLSEIKSKLLNSDLTMDKVEVTNETDPSIIGRFYCGDTR